MLKEQGGFKHILPPPRLCYFIPTQQSIPRKSCSDAKVYQGKKKTRRKPTQSLTVDITAKHRSTYRSTQRDNVTK